MLLVVRLRPDLYSLTIWKIQIWIWRQKIAVFAGAITAPVFRIHKRWLVALWVCEIK